MSGAGVAYNSPINFMINQTVPGSPDPGSVAALTQLYQAMQQVIQAFVSNCGIGPQLASQFSLLNGNPRTLLSGNLTRLYVITSENIVQGAIINLYSNSGVLTARNANATNNTKIADGFCSQIGGITSGQIGEVQLMTGVAFIGGLTVGQRYWLSLTNGLIQNAPPTASGNVEQYLGIAITTTAFFLNIGAWIQH